MANTPCRDIFAAPIAMGPPPTQIPRRDDHPVPRLGIVQPSASAPPPPGRPALPPRPPRPRQTNKFYANMFLGSQAAPTYAHPYSVWWSKGGGVTGSWGLAISHIEANQRVFGPVNSTTGAASYFFNPVGIQCLCLSAAELGPATALTTDHMSASSALVSLRPSGPQSPPAVCFPLVQGMGFVTGEYNGARPVVQTGTFFTTVTRATTDPRPGVAKYKLATNDGFVWLLYARNIRGDPLDLEVVNNGLARARGPFYGTVQVGKLPGDSDAHPSEAAYDQACGAYAIGAEVSGTAVGARGTYTFRFIKEGLRDAPLLMYALPHHVSSFDDATRKAVVPSARLQTTTKGVARGVLADTWTMVEDRLPVDMDFLPWHPQHGTSRLVSDVAHRAARQAAQQELAQDMDGQSNQNSMYFSGKALAKFALAIVCCSEILGETAIAKDGLRKLEAAFARFAQNQQQYPLVYESAWGGLVSSATYVTGDAGADFGNTCYNDHHFHYGYFVLAAAAIGHLDPDWVAANRDYVDALVRDYANPSARDPFFPVSRSFDWYHGHSWAHGLYETWDGKDQESSSEDAMAAYAIKMWGTVSGNSDMASRGNLMLAVLARSLPAYYLYRSDNEVQPANFIGNKVAGILFENKIDHTTWFGGNPEYVQGIHMIPLLPCSALLRDPDFVAEEWEVYFSRGRAEQVGGGWRGILFGNLAMADPATAWSFFSAPGFDPGWLDGGASLTVYLCFAAAFGGA